MDYAKVKGDELIKYPYTISDFLIDCPNNYAPKICLSLAYEGTENQIKTGCSVVLIDEPILPLEKYNLLSHYIHIDEIPSLIDGNWVIKAYIKELSEEEKAVAANAELTKNLQDQEYDA